MPWIFGFAQENKIVSVIMEYLGDFNVGRTFRQPTNQAKEVLSHLAREQSAGVLQTELYDELPEIPKEDLKGCVDELAELKLVRTQKSGTSQNVYLTQNFFERYSLKKKTKLVRKKR